MSEYRPPFRYMQFFLRELAGLHEVARLPGCEEATPDVVDTILEEAGKFAAGVLSPLNVSGDREGARWRRAPAPYRRFASAAHSHKAIAITAGGQRGSGASAGAGVSPTSARDAMGRWVACDADAIGEPGNEAAVPATPVPACDPVGASADDRPVVSVARADPAAMAGSPAASLPGTRATSADPRTAPAVRLSDGP